MEIPNGVTVTLNWEGDNKLWSGGERAGINVQPGATLIITGPDNNGSLEVGSFNNSAGVDNYGAGIGGDKNEPNFGAIIIKSGKVNAYAQVQSGTNSSNAYGAGIGGGYNGTTGSTSGSILIEGGTVTAQCDNRTSTTEGGAGIGGGYNGTVENIMITGGTVTGTSENGDDIGNGNSYSGTKPDVIIAPTSNDATTPSVYGTVGSNVDKLQVNDDKTSTTLTGTVAVQDGTQIYAPGISETTEHAIIGYNIKLINGKLEGDEGTGSHEAKDYPAYISDTYYGKSLDSSNPTTVTIPVGVTCTWDHHFIGWYGLKEGSSSEYEIKETGFSVDIPTTDPSSTKTDIVREYTAVWVDNRYDIVVANLHEWKKDDASTNPPTISVTPQGAIELLKFTLNKGSHEGRLDYVSLDNNVFTGYPVLGPDESYANLDDVTVTVKVKGSTSEGKIVQTPIFIHSDNLVITGVTLKPNHTYDGYAHNNTRDDESGYHAFAFNVEVTGDESIELPEGFTLTEGVHYVVESFQVDGQTPTSTTEVKGSKQIIDAGEYSSIKLKSVMQTEGNEQYGVKFKIGNASETTEYEIPGTLDVAKRNLTLEAINPTITLPENSTAPDFTNWEEYVKVNGIATVNGTSDNVEPTITAQVNSTEKEWWTIPGTYTATFTIESLSGDKASNYQEEATATITIKVGSDKDEENDNNRPGHIDRPAKYYNIYIDTVCPGLKLELSKDVVKEGGQVSVYLTVEEQCDTTGFAFEYKRGLFGRWEDLKPLEGVQPGEYIIKHIYTDIYIRALDAIVEEEEEPTGIEDVEGVKVYAQDGNIYVYTPNRERVMIVSMNGALVKNAEQEGMQSYSVSRGIYIVRIGDKVFKIKN